MRSLLALLALVCASSLAYEIADVCDIEITVSYTDNSEYVFSLTEQNTVGEVVLKPGTFQLDVKGYLCANPNTIAFQGTSADVVLVAGGAPQSIDIVALDTQTYNEAATSGGSFSPVVLSLSVSPTIVRVGATTTIAVSAVDPIPTHTPSGYLLEVTGSGTYPNTDTCGAGTSCSRTYTAGSSDSGYLDFTFTIEDDGSDSDTTIDGKIRVDASAAVEFDFETYFIPTIDGAINPIPSSAAMNLADNATTFTFDVIDPDLTLHSDTLTLTVTPSVVRSYTDNDDLTAIGCLSADVTQTHTTVGNTRTYVVSWDPKTTHTANSNTYGETFCKFSFFVTDSMNLVSQTVQTTAKVTGTSESAQSVSANQPYFEYVYIQATSVTAGDHVYFEVRYIDPDSALDFEVTSGGLFTDDTVSAITGCSSGCVRDLSFNATETTGTYTITLKVFEPTDHSLVDIRTISVVVGSARRREAVNVFSLVPARRSASDIPSLATTFTIQDGVLSASIGDQVLGTPGSTHAPAGSENGISTMVAVAAGVGILVGVVIAAAVVLSRRRSAAASRVVLGAISVEGAEVAESTA